jgi:hypothetical protein
LPTKGNPHLFGRVPLKYRAALQLEARQLGISPSEHVRNILKEHFLKEYSEKVVTNQTSGGNHLEALVNLTKRYITLAKLSRQASKIPLRAEKIGGCLHSPSRGVPKWPHPRRGGKHRRVSMVPLNVKSCSDIVALATCALRIPGKF